MSRLLTRHSPHEKRVILPVADETAVTPVARTLRLIVAMLCMAAFALPLIAQSADEIAATEVVVPVVGSIWGMNAVQWRTDVTLTNDQRQEITVALILPAQRDQPAIVVTIGGGDTMEFHDVFAEAFSLNNGISPLLVRTLGRRSVGIKTTVYAVRDGAQVAAQPIDIFYRDTYFPLRALHGLAFTDDYRTNIGFSNLSETAATFTVALQRLEGRTLAMNQLTLPPNTLLQMPLQLLFPLISKGDNFSLVVECGTAHTNIYGSVIENSSSNARFISPTIGMSTEELWQ
jgi:hypothetical protein